MAYILNIDFMIGIIFDCDGVLVDTENAHFLSWKKTLEKRGIAWDKTKHFAFCGYPGSTIAKQFSQMFGFSSEALLEDKREFFEQFQRQGFAPMSFTIQFVKQLFERRHSLNFKLGLASGARKKDILINLKQQGLGGIFDAIISGYDDLSHYVDPEGTNKPKPYIYLQIAQILGLRPSQCVAIEDSGPGILAASRAGMVTFAIPGEFSQNHNFSLATYRLTSNQEIDTESFIQKIQKVHEFKHT